MSGIKESIYPFTSPVKRVQETAQHIISEIPEIGMSKARIVNLLAGPSFNQFQELLYKKIKEEKLSVQDVCNQFFNGELEIKPKDVTKDYINTLRMIFNNSIRRDRKISIIAYRHGDKDSAGNLSETGIEQAKNLGKNLKKELDKSKEEPDKSEKEPDKSEKELIILAATHNVINETLLHTLFSDEELPKERDNLLDFTEKVKYTFYPQNGANEPYLEVNWRGHTKKISYKRFQELKGKINNPSPEEPGKIKE